MGVIPNPKMAFIFPISCILALIFPILIKYFPKCVGKGSFPKSQIKSLDDVTCLPTCRCSIFIVQVINVREFSQVNKTEETSIWCARKLLSNTTSDFIWPFLTPYRGVIPNPKKAFIFPISCILVLIFPIFMIYFPKCEGKGSFPKPQIKSLTKFLMGGGFFNHVRKLGGIC